MRGLSSLMPNRKRSPSPSDSSASSTARGTPASSHNGSVKSSAGVISAAEPTKKRGERQGAEAKETNQGRELDSMALLREAWELVQKDKVA